jgi:hypothetical protein
MWQTSSHKPLLNCYNNQRLFIYNAHLPPLQGRVQGHSSCLCRTVKSSFCGSGHCAKATKRNGKENIQNIVFSQLKHVACCSHTICHIFRLALAFPYFPHYQPLGKKVVGTVSARFKSVKEPQYVKECYNQLATCKPSGRYTVAR